MVQISDEEVKNVGHVLLSRDKPLKERFRALFTLKNVGGPTAIEFIDRCFSDDSCLLKHELAYCLGQMQDKSALPILNRVLSDLNQEPMVRHEAAEAIGAIGQLDSLNILEQYLNDKSVEVRETCEIAIGRIKWFNDKNSNKSDCNVFASVDPTPALAEKDVDRLRGILLDPQATLFDRYQSMFALRDIAAGVQSTNADNAILALGEALNRVDSALFRHELAFVLGQLQSPLATEHLNKQLANLDENEMVRHECAEALGAIATEKSMEILNTFVHDDKRVVKESCEVALDMGEYFTGNDFQYANTLSSASSNHKL